MSPHWLTQLSDRNPQLLREVKGRMKPRYVLVMLALSLVTQLLLVGYNWQQLGLADGGMRISSLMWRIWWFDSFNTLTWVALTLLLFLGSYLLINDIAKEEQRGTLDFVRLSPESAQSIVLGKLLGVPILLYWAIALTVPLHLWSAASAGLPLQAVMGVYLVSAVFCVFVYSFSLLYGLSWGAKANGLYAMPIVGISYAALQLVGLYWTAHYRYLIGAEAHQQYWYTAFGNWFVWSTCFLLIAQGAQSIWFWRLCVHRFHHPPLRF